MKKFMLGFICCLLLCTITYVVAESINSNEVLYDNSNSKTSYDNVQDVLDNMYNIIDHNSLAFSLLIRDNNSISSTLQGELYRYQGTTADNYICFGTTNKDICVNDNNKYMYRIVGITTNGKMKLIKKEVLNTAYQWHSTGYNDVTWDSCALKVGLNGDYFLTNTDYVPDSSWSNRIAEVDWHYYIGTDVNKTAAEMAALELSGPSTRAKIGLLNIYDYYYGLPGGNNCSSSGVPNVCKTSWIHLWNNQRDNLPGGYEWTISLYDRNLVWSFQEGGAMYYGASWAWYAEKSDTNNARPVFYLDSNQTIASGSGTIDDPYILS